MSPVTPGTGVYFPRSRLCDPFYPGRTGPEAAKWPGINLLLHTGHLTSASGVAPRIKTFEHGHLDLRGTRNSQRIVELFQSALSAIQWNNVLPSESPADATLFPTLYVGETSFGLYAINAFVDQHTITYAPKYLGPPLLEGPSPIAISVSCVPSSFEQLPSRPPISQSLPHRRGRL